MHHLGNSGQELNQIMKLETGIYVEVMDDHNLLIKFRINSLGVTGGTAFFGMSIRTSVFIQDDASTDLPLLMALNILL